MYKTILMILAVLLLQACSKQFVHEQKPLKSDMIPAFNVNGRVTITDAQPSTDKYLVYSNGGIDWSSDLHTLTEGVVQQATEEFGKHGHILNAAKTKTIGLKVLSLESHDRVFVFHSVMHMEAVLGDGERVELTNEHTTGYNIQQDLDGCMDEGVMTLFTDKRVLAYLAQ